MSLTRTNPLRLSLLVLALTSLTACGGGGGSESSTPTPVDPTNTPEDNNTNHGNNPIPDSGQGGVSFSQATYNAAEADRRVTITVNRNGDSSESASVDYSIAGITATEGDDFTEVSGILEWAANDSQPKTFTLPVSIDPDGTEGTETIELSLSNPVGTDLGQFSTATLSLEDTPCTVYNEFSLSESRTFSDTCYIIDYDILVKNAATMTVSPGVHLFFTAGYRLEVEEDGILTAVGTAEDPIVFSGEIKAPGYWDGIEISSLATSKIHHAIIEYGGGSGYLEANVGVMSDGKLSMENTLSRFSSTYGVKFGGFDSKMVSFKENTITQNQMAPITAGIEHVGELDPSSQYTGNVAESGESQDFIRVWGNSMRVDQIWPNLDVPYHMSNSGDISVHSKLTLEPGVRLEFAGEGGLGIENEGTLIAKGTEELPIVFTGLEKIPGYWRGIQFTFNSNPNEMDYTVVEYGGGPGTNVLANVGVFGSHGRLSLKNSILQYSANNGFYFGSQIALEMDAVVVTGNARPGVLGFKDAGKLGRHSDYTGNTDDRIKLYSVSTSVPEFTLPSLGVPFYLYEPQFNFETDGAMTVEPGVELQFAPNIGLIVKQSGALIANGTADKPILFTGAEKVKGYWKGIEFVFSNSNSNSIQHATVEYGGQTAGSANAAIRLNGVTGLPTYLTISDATVRGSLEDGISLSTGSTFNASGLTFIDIDGQDIRDPR